MGLRSAEALRVRYYCELLYVACMAGYFLTPTLCLHVVRVCYCRVLPVLYMGVLCDRLHSTEVLHARAYGHVLYDRLYYVEVLRMYERISAATYLHVMVTNCCCYFDIRPDIA